MGLIRKSLAVSTLGLVSGSSKKQRVAKATMKSSAATAAFAKTAVATAQLAERHAAEEREFRYATDPVYRKYIDDKRAAETEARQLQLERAAEAQRVRRERNAYQLQQARRFTTRAVATTALVVAFLIVGLVVWMPQFIVAKVKRSPVQLWMLAEMTSAWNSTVHSHLTPLGAWHALVVTDRSSQHTSGGTILRTVGDAISSPPASGDRSGRHRRL